MQLTWTPLPMRTANADGLYNIWHLMTVQGSLYGLGPSGGVALFAPEGFTTVVRDDAAGLVPVGVGAQIRYVKDDALHAVTTRGAVARYDLGQKRWQVVHGDDESFGLSWALHAYDPTRGVLVVWGPRKAKGRKDLTRVFTGAAWEKPKTGAKPSAADLGVESDHAFTLYFDPTLGGVVRVGPNDAALYDGKTWVPLALSGDAKAWDRWDRIVVTDPATQRVFSVQRSAAACDVFELVSERAGVRLAPRARFPTLQPKDNCAFESGGYDAARRVFVALTNKGAATLDFSPLLAQHRET